MDKLRQHRHPLTAAVLAEQLQVSVRTVYRDIQALIALGAGIDGEAGIGYLLRSGFFLPPLMFDEAELEALALGLRWVEVQGDDELVAAARNVLAKVAAAGRIMSVRKNFDHKPAGHRWLLPPTGKNHPVI